MSAAAIETALKAAQSGREPRRAWWRRPGSPAAANTSEPLASSGVAPTRTPMSADTLFWIASMTKVLTSIAALQLSEQGRLSLDQDAAGLVPDINDVPILEGFDAAGAPRLRAAKKTVTLQHLLTHTAGFGYVFMNKDLARCAEQKGLGFGDAMAIPRACSRRASAGNTASIPTLWARRWRRSSGQTLDVYLQKAACLRRAGHEPDSTFGPRPRAAGAQGGDACAAARRRLCARWSFRCHRRRTRCWAGAGCISTAPDYLTFLKCAFGRRRWRRTGAS